MLESDDLEIVSLVTDPSLADAIRDFNHANWPEFMFHDRIANDFWADLHRLFPEYQFVIRERDSGSFVAQVNSLPIVWTGPIEDLPDRGWDWALEQGLRDGLAGEKPTLQCALQIAIGPSNRGRGISTMALSAMKDIGRKKGMKRLVAPVRPNRKPDYPLIPMESYIGWTNSDGLPFDPWMRVHVRQGARVVKICPQSMLITGTVAEWEQWSGLAFPESAEYVVPGALSLVKIDREQDKGIYVEPNVWILHELT